MTISLDSLSPELIDLIVAELGPSCSLECQNIARYATISRPWQYSIERVLFRKLSIDCYKLDEVPVMDKRRHSLSEVGRQSYLE